MNKDEQITLLRDALVKAKFCVDFMAIGYTPSGAITDRANHTKVVVDAALAATAAPAHSDHPMRHWDHTCPACNSAAPKQPRPIAWMAPEGYTVTIDPWFGSVERNAVAAEQWIPLYLTAPNAQQEKWISVEDRLPSDDCKVLAATWLRMDGTQNVELEYYRSGQGGFVVPVTHWMLLPPPPAIAAALKESK